MPLFKRAKKSNDGKKRGGLFGGLNLFKKKKSRDAERIARFRPSKHGYAFGNSFAVADVIDDLPRPLRKVTPAQLRDESYGLCGGMTFSASDFFEAGVRRPATTSVPRPGSALYGFIRARQIDSFGISFRHIPRVLEWMGASDRKVQERTAEQVRKVVEHLQAGKFAPLYLIRTSGNVPWDNHQVMAYDYRDRTSTSGCVDLKIYDPNYENDDTQTIEVEFLSDGRVVCCQKRNGVVLEKEPVRGFFTRPYTSRIAFAKRVAGV